MTSYPPVDGLPESAAACLLAVFSKLSELRQPRLADWAESVTDALLGRLVKITTGVEREGETVEPVPLAALDAAELEGLHWVISAAAADADRYALAWLKALGRLIISEFDRRIREQAIIDAKASAIDAEEQRIDREKQPPPNLNGLPPWSEASKPPES